MRACALRWAAAAAAVAGAAGTLGLYDRADLAPSWGEAVVQLHQATW